MSCVVQKYNLKCDRCHDMEKGCYWGDTNRLGKKIARRSKRADPKYTKSSSLFFLTAFYLSNTYFLLESRSPISKSWVAKKMVLAKPKIPVSKLPPIPRKTSESKGKAKERPKRSPTPVASSSKIVEPSPNTQSRRLRGEFQPSGVLPASDPLASLHVPIEVSGSAADSSLDRLLFQRRDPNPQMLIRTILDEINRLESAIYLYQATVRTYEQQLSMLQGHSSDGPTGSFGADEFDKNLETDVDDEWQSQASP